jgi:uncharacterized membrane protein YcaP (DUF421 family)
MDELFQMVRLFLGEGLESKEINAAQMVARALIIYVVTVFIVRLGKKRFMGRATAFDVILGIIIGSIASRAVTGNAPLVPAVAATAALVFTHWVFSAIAFRSESFGFFVKGKDDVIIREGKINPVAMRKTHMSDDDLQEDLRGEGVAEVREVKEARLERSGGLSVIKK